MHVQPWPLANRSTARCWVRERACLRLMLFLFPAPEHPTPLRAALCGWPGHGGDWTEGERTSPLRSSANFAPIGSSEGYASFRPRVRLLDRILQVRSFQVRPFEVGSSHVRPVEACAR